MAHLAPFSQTEWATLFAHFCSILDTHEHDGLYKALVIKGYNLKPDMLLAISDEKIDGLYYLGQNNEQLPVNDTDKACLCMLQDYV